MSAFVVEDKVINEIVACLASHRQYGAFTFHQGVLAETGCDLVTTDGCEQLARAMFALNVNAVDQRYGEGQAAEFRPLDFKYKPAVPGSVIQAYKSFSCWLYQCAEGDVPEFNLLYAAMCKLHDRMAHEIVRALPAYEKAK